MQFMPRSVSLFASVVLWFVLRQGESMLHEPNTCTNVNATAGGTDDPPCQDTHVRCKAWAEEGECEENAGYMLLNCACSCNSCPSYTKNDWDDEAQYAMGPLKEEIEWIIKLTEQYMQTYNRYFSKSHSGCRNKYKGCSHWSLLGK